MTPMVADVEVDVIRKPKEIIKNQEKPTKYTKEEVTKATIEWFLGDDLAAETWVKKYALRDNDDNLLERTPDNMFDREAKALAGVETDKAKWFGIFRDHLAGFRKLVMGGSSMAGLGNPRKVSLSNCYVIPSPTDDIRGVYEAVYKMAQIQAYRGGVGLDISTLRPEGSAVSNAAKSSSGAWSWADQFSYTTRKIGQRGRVGALMITMRVDHPDILKFITMKSDLKMATGANLSVKITDDFMRAVEGDKEISLWFKFLDNKYPDYSKKISARVVWDAIVHCATTTAEPGILMWDNIINNSPADAYAIFGFRTEATNPCVAGDSRLLTPEGHKTVRELWEMSGKQELVPEYAYAGQMCGPARGTRQPSIRQYGELKIVNSNGVVKATNIYRTSECSVIYKLALENGVEIKATSSHMFILSNGDRKRLEELQVGDELPLNKQRIFGNFHYPEYARLAGWVIGDGSVCMERGQQRAHVAVWSGDFIEVLPTLRDNLARLYTISNKSTNQNPSYDGLLQESEYFGNKKTMKSSVLGRLLNEDGVAPGNKHHIPKSIWQGDKETIAAFLQGLWSADGSVQTNKAKGCVSIRNGQIHRELLVECQLLLNQFGITSTIRFVHGERKQLMADGEGGMKEYVGKAAYELIISGGENCQRFIKEIGFVQHRKNNKASKWFEEHPGSNNSETKYVSKIKSIEYAGEEETFCLTEPENNEVTFNSMLTGQCAELPLCPNDTCRIASIYLAGFVRSPFTDMAAFDFDAFKETIGAGVRALDNTIELDKMPFKEQEEMGRKGRRIGLGTHGLADCLLKLGIKYDSDEAIKFIDKLYEFLKDCAYNASVDLAIEKGAFPVFDWELEKDNAFIKRLRPETRERIAKHGRRNIALLTCAPTGTISVMSQSSSGIEPVFRFTYVRRVKINHGEDIVPDFVDVNGDKFKEFTVYHHALREYMNVKNTKDAGNLPETFITSDKIDWERRVDIQAAMQKHIDHSISSTINLPKGTAEETVAKLYMRAWKAGLKGVTVYVEGCRSGVLISGEAQDEITRKPAIKRPDALDAVVHVAGSNGHSYNIIIGFYKNAIYEMFALKQKEAGLIDGIKGQIIKHRCEDGNARYDFESGPITIKALNRHEDSELSAFTRIVSMALRHGIPLETLSEQLHKSKGTVSHIAKSLNRVLSQYCKEIKGLECQECHSTNTIKQENCLKCLDCGAHGCG